MKLRDVLRDRAGEPDGGGTVAIDPGAPYVHSADRPAEKKPAKAEEPPEVKTLRERAERAERERDEAKQSERYWADRAKAQRNGDPPAEPDPDEDPEPVVTRRTAPTEAEKPEKLLDDMSVEGLEALRKRGFITQAELDERIKAVVQRVERTTQRAQEQSSWDQRMNAEFPEVAEDARRVERGEKPQTEIYTRSAALFQEMLRENPALKNSPEVLMLALRQTKKELKLEKDLEAAKTRGSQDSRRERIDNQRGERPGVGESDMDDPDDRMSPTARLIAKNMGITQAEYLAHADGPPAARRNGHGKQ